MTNLTEGNLFRGLIAVAAPIVAGNVLQSFRCRSRASSPSAWHQRGLACGGLGDHSAGRHTLLDVPARDLGDDHY